MSATRLLELWAPPAGYRLASVVATTYHLQADFLEEDLLPLALGLRHTPARGREFRRELARARQVVDVTIYLHPDGYQPGMRRSPRVDLIPVPESSARKLHAKVALLRFVHEQDREVSSQIVRLITGSANLTASGYRNNIEIAVAVDDAPSGAAVNATAVRDAAAWLAEVLPPKTDQARAQQRYMRAVFSARPMDPDRQGMFFLGLPRPGGVLSALGSVPLGEVRTLTAASPFWPTGDGLADVVSRLLSAFGSRPQHVRLIGPARAVEGRLYPEMPPALLQALMREKVDTSIAFAEPQYGCATLSAQADDDEGEYDRSRSARAEFAAWRDLHAKLLLVEGSKASLLAMGSFNFTRRGLGLFDGLSNTEAGLIWRIPAASASKFAPLVVFAGPWQRVEGAPELLVKAPEPIQGESGQQWPKFILSLRASRDGLLIEGDPSSWPERLRVSMRDIRARLVQLERNFDPWQIDRPADPAPMQLTLPLVASWITQENHPELARYPALADLEVTLEWDDQATVLPVVFVEKHEFPVVERAEREDERLLLDWFLGLRPEVESEPGGLAHGIDPDPTASAPDPSDSSGILSYLIRDFVHALPGIRAHLEEGAATETGVRAALLGPRSPAKLAEEILAAFMQPLPGQARKTVVAAAFQLIELRKLVASARLPALPEGKDEALRSNCLARIDAAVDRVVAKLESPLEPALQRYISARREVPHAAA